MPYLPTEVHGDFAESFEGGVEIFDDFLHEHVGLGKVAGVCVKGGELPWEINPQGVMKWYMRSNIDSTAHKFVMFYAQEIPPASSSGKQCCQGGVVFLVVEGAGYTFIDERRYDWKKLQSISRSIDRTLRLA